MCSMCLDNVCFVSTTIFQMFISIGPPTTPTHLTVWACDSHSIYVVWNEEFNGGLKQMFLVQYRTDTTPQWTNLTDVIAETGLNTIQKAVISSLQPNTRYLVRVLAYNKYGYKDFTKQQEALTLPPGINEYKHRTSFAYFYYSV